MSLLDLMFGRPTALLSQDELSRVAHDRIQAAYEARRAGDNPEVVGMGEVPRDRTGSDEARAYAFALDLVRRRGGAEASRIADLVVRNVQILTREGV